MWWHALALQAVEMEEIANVDNLLCAEIPTIDIGHIETMPKDKVIMYIDDMILFSETTDIE